MSRFKEALDPNYWKKLNPHLSVNEDGAYAGFEAPPIAQRLQRDLVSKFAEEGYFQTRPVLAKPVIEAMRECVESLKRADWPPVFAFAYDQFWLVSRENSLVQLLSAILGPHYKQIPHVWCHYVRPSRGAAGWPPHLDGPGRNNRMTIWIPLTDAAVDNGCMYVMQKDLAPLKLTENYHWNLESIDEADLVALLRSIRALPTRAGSILGWGHDVVHWGAICNQEGNPRISISLEFISDNEDPVSKELPLLDVNSRLPTFAQRLHIIAQGILNYQKFETAIVRYGELAKRLVNHTEERIRGRGKA